MTYPAGLEMRLYLHTYFMYMSTEGSVSLCTGAESPEPLLLDDALNMFQITDRGRVAITHINSSVLAQIH